MAWITTGLVIGVVLGLVVIVIARRAPNWSPRWSARSTRELELPVSYDDAFARGLRAAGMLNVVEDPLIRDGVIEARVGSNLKTYGNVVTIQVHRTGERRTALTISSRPVFPQLFDWGRSKALVDQVTAELGEDL